MLAALLALAVIGPLEAHHSLARFDTATPLWVKGTIVRFERINPHSVIFLDQEMEDGRIHRWAVDGPAVAGLAAMGVDENSLEPGDVIEVCGFATPAGVAAQKKWPAGGGPDAGSVAPTVQGELMNGHLLVLADGQKRFWSDYGLLHKCITDEERASLQRDWRSAAQP